MRVSSVLERLVRAATRRPLAFALGIGGLAAVAAVAAALTLSPSAGTDTLVGRGSDTSKATRAYHERFGDDAVIILIKGRVANLVGTSDIERVLGLEGCIAGNIPAGRTPIGGAKSPCGALARDKPAQVVYGPGTFINEAVRQIQEQFSVQQTQAAARAASASQAAQELGKARGLSIADQQKLAAEARQLVQNEFLKQILQLGLRYGIRTVPRLNDPNFVFQLVFDPRRGAGVPKARFAYLFPTQNASLIQVRLRPDLSDAERNRAIELIRAATHLRTCERPGGAGPLHCAPRFALQNGGSYVVTGAPVVVSDLTSAISHSIFVLLFAALLVMAATLALVFRTRRLRLLPLAVALAAVGLVFGAMALVGASLTMASIAVLPVLLGLAVDYAIQLQSRYDEAESRGEADPAASAAALGGPTIAAAALATTAGFLALLLSPVPMVRGFGLLLVLGIVVAFLCALTAGFATLELARRRRGGGASGPARAQAARAAFTDSARGAGDLLADAWAWLVRARRSAPPVTVAVAAALGAGLVVAGALLDLPALYLLAALIVAALPPVTAALLRAWHGALAVSARRPSHVLTIALAVAVVGFAADTQTKVVSDLTKLVPQDLGTLRSLTDLQKATDVSGEIDVTVQASDLTDPRVLGWMTSYQQELLQHYGYSANRGCGRAKLCPALSLPDLFRSSGGVPSRQRIKALLDAVPPYFSQAVITPDRRTATLAFGIRLMPLDEQQRVIDEMRQRLDPPAGVTAELVGLPVLAAEANSAVSSHWRRLLTLVAGLLGVALVLLAVFRRVERALVPLVPIALASGWSALVLFLVRVPLNPMSVTLGALVIAITTEFSVLLAERYRQERAEGLGRDAALARTYRSTGTAVLASGATAIAGFAVLVFSDIRMLRDFGLVTVIDLTASLIGVLIVLPAVLVLAEQGELVSLPSRLLRRLARARPRLRRPRAA